LFAKLALPLLEKQSILIQASFVCAATGGNSFKIEVSTAKPLFDHVNSKKAREKQDSFHDLKKERSFNDWAVKHVLAAASHHRVVSL